METHGKMTSAHMLHIHDKELEKTEKLDKMRRYIQVLEIQLEKDDDNSRFCILPNDFLGNDTLNEEL